MWFLIGLFTVLGAAVFFTRWRLASHWRGEQLQQQNQPYELYIQRNKGRITQVNIGISSASALAFCLKAESGLDRFFKHIGLSEEQQLNRLHFDENIYVISDDIRLSHALKHQPALMQQLEHLFERAHWPLFVVKKLWCQNGRLWLEAKPLERVEEPAAQQFAQNALPLLVELESVLQQKAPSHSGSKDYFIFKAAILLGVSTALAVNGGVQLFRMMFVRFPVVLDNAALMRSAAFIGVAILFILLFSCIKWLGRTSRAHLVLLELLLVGGFGAFSTAYMELRDYNIDFDNASAANVHTSISEYYTTRCGKRNRSTCYHIVLAPWPGYDKPLKLQVDYDTYRQFATGANVQIQIHPGSLAHRWIDTPQP